MQYWHSAVCLRPCSVRVLLCKMTLRNQLERTLHSYTVMLSAAVSYRPGWSSLAPQTAAQVRLVAASTAPPIIHRQVLPNGSAILPVLSNPPPEQTSPAAAPGQPPAAPTNIVSVDAEAFAAAGGRMTSWEWQQLQRFRDAVAECRSMPDASPLKLQAEQLLTHSLTTGEPGVSFAVKQPVLTPHRRLMDSVCKFAFPATHGLLTAGWQLQPHAQQQAAGHPAAGSAGVQAAGHGSQSSQQEQHAQAGMARQQQAQQQQGMPRQQQQQGLVLPVPAPALQQQPGHLASFAGQLDGELFRGQAAATSGRAGSDHGSSGGCLQPQASQSAAAAPGAQAEPIGLGRRGSLGIPAAAHAGLAGPSRHADPALQLRVQAAAGAAAAAVARGSGDGHDRRQSWGSAGGADSQAHSMQQQQQHGEQQQQSWGTEDSRRLSNATNQAGNSAASALSGGGVVQLCQHMPGPVPAPALQELAHHAAVLAREGHATHQAGASTDEAHHVQFCGSHAPLADRQQPGASIQQGTPGQQQVAHQQQCMLEGAGSIPAAPFDGLHLPPTMAGVLDLPAFWQPSRSRDGHLTMGSCAGAREGTPAAGQTSAQQQQQSAGAASPSVRTEARSSSSSTAAQAVAALQRALVEDFVLYEEASAARQHVVGILVAVEQGDAAAGQRLLAPACAELVAATAPAAVPNRLAPFLNSPAVLTAATSARAAGAGPEGVASAAAVAAAEEYCRHVQGISRVVGSAGSCRAALEASPRQLRQQRQQQQALLVRALQQVSNRVPWLSRLLKPLQQSLGLDSTGSQAAAAAASAEAGSQQQGGVAHSRSDEHQTAQQQAQQATAAQGQNMEVEQPAGQSVSAEADAGQNELQAAVVELIMQLPELLHGLPGPALLSYEQYRQRYTQAQQLAAHAMQLLLPGAGEDEGAAAAAADGVAAELAASGLLAAASAAMAASQATPTAGPAHGGAPGQHHASAGHLFANILDSLRGPGAGAGFEQAAGTQGAAEAALAAAYGVRGAASAATGFLTRTAAFAAANRLADGLIRPAHGMPASSIGLSRVGSLAGAGQVGAWRLPAGAAAAAAAGGLMTPGATAGLGMGAFAPTGTGALLSGGLLAEGGVAGDSILDDVLHGNVRRITCHGLYELCAALAQPTGQGSPPAAAMGQQLGGEGAVESVAGHSLVETDDSNRSSEGRVLGQHVAEAVATVAAAAAAVESNRRSSNHSMGPPGPGSLAGSKRRLSSTVDEQERPLKH